MTHSVGRAQYFASWISLRLTGLAGTAEFYAEIAVERLANGLLFVLLASYETQKGMSREERAFDSDRVNK